MLNTGIIKGGESGVPAAVTENTGAIESNDIDIATNVGDIKNLELNAVFKNNEINSNSFKIQFRDNGTPISYIETVKGISGNSLEFKVGSSNSLTLKDTSMETNLNVVSDRTGMLVIDIREFDTTARNKGGVVVITLPTTLEDGVYETEVTVSSPAKEDNHKLIITVNKVGGVITSVFFNKDIIGIEVNTYLLNNVIYLTISNGSYPTIFNGETVFTLDRVSTNLKNNPISGFKLEILSLVELTTFETGKNVGATSSNLNNVLTDTSYNTKGGGRFSIVEPKNNSSAIRLSMGTAFIVPILARLSEHEMIVLEISLFEYSTGEYRELFLSIYVSNLVYESTRDNFVALGNGDILYFSVYEETAGVDKIFNLLIETEGSGFEHHTYANIKRVTTHHAIGEPKEYSILKINTSDLITWKTGKVGVSDKQPFLTNTYNNTGKKSLPEEINIGGVGSKIETSTNLVEFKANANDMEISANSIKLQTTTNTLSMLDKNTNIDKPIINTANSSIHSLVSPMTILSHSSNPIISIEIPTHNYNNVVNMEILVSYFSNGIGYVNVKLTMSAYLMGTGSINHGDVISTNGDVQHKIKMGWYCEASTGKHYILVGIMDDLPYASLFKPTNFAVTITSFNYRVNNNLASDVVLAIPNQTLVDKYLNRIYNRDNAGQGTGEQAILLKHRSSVNLQPDAFNISTGDTVTLNNKFLNIQPRPGETTGNGAILFRNDSGEYNGHIGNGVGSGVLKRIDLFTGSNTFLHVKAPTYMIDGTRNGIGDIYRSVIQKDITITTNNIVTRVTLNKVDAVTPRVTGIRASVKIGTRYYEIGPGGGRSKDLELYVEDDILHIVGLGAASNDLVGTTVMVSVEYKRDENRV